MTISFNEIPSSIRIPWVGIEFDGSQASQGPALLAYRALLIGQKISAGTGTADTLDRVTSADQVRTLAGRGSVLHRMAIAWFASNTMTETWIGILADNGAGVAATGTIVVSGPATASGTIFLLVGGEPVDVAVTSGDASTVIATAIGAAINANGDLAVTSGVASSTVTNTFRHKGLAGNSYPVTYNYRDGDELPAGVGLTITQTGGVVAGTTAPVLTGLIAAMGDQWFHIIAHPYTDATSLSALEAELTSRNGPMRQIQGQAFTSAGGSFGTLTTLGETRNNRHNSIFAQPGAGIVTPPMEFAAETAAIIAKAGAADPARPFQTLAYVHALPPTGVLFTAGERGIGAGLLYSGIATSVVAAGGVVQVERPITTYRLNAAGAADTAYLDVTTLLTLMYLRYSFRVRMQTKYPRHKLADDDTRVGPGQAVMTPKLGKAEAISWFLQMEELGLCERFNQFKTDLQVVRSTTDPNRLEFLLPNDLVNMLVVVAAQIQFRL